MAQLGALIPAAIGGSSGMLGLAGTVLSTVSAVSQGRAANKQAQFEAEQMERNALSERASAQRAAMEERRKSRIMQSRVQALAGGSGMDPGVVNLMENLEGEGEYRALTARYEGEIRARGLTNQAAATRYSGSQAQTAGLLRGAGSLLSGASILSGGTSLYEKYKGTK